MSYAVQSCRHDKAGGIDASPLRWFRATAIAFSLVFIIYAVWSSATTHFWPKASDFVSFWAAGRLALEGNPALAYNIAVHHAAEQAVGPVQGLLPFPYPPPFLAIVSPFAALPFGPAFYLWVVATAGFYLWATKRVAALPYALAMPPAYINLLIGQNGFLISGIFISGLGLTATWPWFGGAILGLMVLKPQLALLLPIAMIAGREWRVIGGAVLSVSTLLIMGLILFGWHSYEAFFRILPRYVELVRDSKLAWNELASPFALARFVGVPQTSALLIHSGIALMAAVLTARAWWRRLDERVPILAAATMLISPYLYTYDALLLVVPLGWMLSAGRYPYVAIVWLCAFLPIITYYTPFFGVNLTSVAAIISLWVLHLGTRSGKASDDPIRLTPCGPVEASATS